MRLFLSVLLGTATAALGMTGCGGISDCGEDAAKCSSMLVENADKCAIAYQLKQGEEKRKHCENAVKVVQKAQAKAAVPGLIAMVKAPDGAAPDDMHRVEAAKALGAIGDKSAVDALVESLDPSAGTSSDNHDKNANRSNEAFAEVLGNLGDPKACPKLLDAMTKSRHDYTVLKSIRALGQLQCKAAVGPLAEVAQKHDNKFIRKNAIIALGDVGDPAATDALIYMMFVEMQGVSFYPEASFALFQVGPAAAEALLNLMSMKNDAVNKYFEKTGGMKETAIKAKAGFVLGDLRDQRAVEPLIDAFKNAAKGDPVLAVYASAPLGGLGDKRAVPVLKDQMLNVDASQRDPIMRALVMLGDRSVVPDMIKGMTMQNFVEGCMKLGVDKDACTEDKSARFGAQKAATDHATDLAGAANAEALKKVIAEEKEPEIKKYMEERAVRVDAAVECKEDAACWVKKLSDANAFVREKAAWELSWLKDPSTLDALVKALSDKDNYVRSASIYAYWSFGDKRAIPAIEKQLKDDEGAATYVRVNQDLKRLLVALKRKA
ncbi:MAG: HEAT repeat domain-containing protein [Myxococcota bacterium]